MSAEKIVSIDQNPLNLKTSVLTMSKPSGRVDINTLKARVRKIQEKENKQNLVIFSFFAALIFFTGAILSL